MKAINAPGLRLASWLLIASPIVLILNLLLFSGATKLPSGDERIDTVARAAEYVSRNGSGWIAFNLTGLLFTTLACAGLAIIAAILRGTKARLLGIGALVCVVGALLLWIFLVYLMVGLVAGPNNLPPLVAEQPVNNGEGPIIGLTYQNLSSLLLTLSLILVAVGLFVSGLLRRTGIAVAVVTLVLGVLQLIAFGGIVPLVVIFGLPIAIGLLRREDIRGRSRLVTARRRPRASVPQESPQ